MKVPQWPAPSNETLCAFEYHDIANALYLFRHENGRRISVSAVSLRSWLGFPPLWMLGDEVKP
jgi:hypothetical protein